MPITSKDIRDHFAALRPEQLPGSEAQLRMAPRTTRKLYSPTPGSREAAVMILLYPEQQEWHTCFIKRSNHNPNDRHGGQISFPGGKVETTDRNFEHTALREVEEEIGVMANSIEVLSPLTSLYVFASNFMVYPFVGLLESAPSFILQPSEVEDIIPSQVKTLFAPEIRQITDLPVRGMTLKDVPYFDLNGQILWGATSMILSEFLEAVRDLDW